MTGDCHVRFCEGLRVKLLRSTLFPTGRANSMKIHGSSKFQRLVRLAMQCQLPDDRESDVRKPPVAYTIIAVRTMCPGPRRDA